MAAAVAAGAAGAGAFASAFGSAALVVVPPGAPPGASARTLETEIVRAWSPWVTNSILNQLGFFGTLISEVSQVIVAFSMPVVPGAFSRSHFGDSVRARFSP